MYLTLSLIYTPYTPPLQLPPFPSVLQTLSVPVTHYLSFYPPPPPSLSLQQWGSTALLWASSNGHAEAIKALLTVPDINVNRADVSLYLLTPSYLVLGGMCEVIYLTLSLTITLAMMTYHPPMHNMHPNPMKNISKCVYLIVVIV